MIGFKRILALLLIAGVSIVILLAGCTKFSPGDVNENIPPQTTLSFSPDEGDDANYRVRMNWFGWDPDGKVNYYWTKWDSFDWVRVASTDSVFLVSAPHVDSLLDPLKGYEYHSFSVKAVDNEGAEDPSPEHITFNAFTLVPNTEIVRGPSGVTGPMVTFEWSGTDRDGVIVSYDYEFLYWDISASEWILDTSEDSLDVDHTTANFGPLTAGDKRFRVWATDDAGARDQTPAIRDFTCNPELAGPKLFAYSNIFGLRVFRGPVWNSAYNLPTQIFAGERLSFRWAASAESYGGQVMGYRHAYDDTSTWPAWSVYDTEFSVTPTIGRHSLYISAKDNANVVTRGRFYFDVVEATLDEYILIVDDWDLDENSANPLTPSDEDRNAFWDGLLAGYEHQRVEWQPDQHEHSGEPQPPDVETLRSASTVIWYADIWDETSELADLFNPQMQGYNTLAGYMRVGGNLILSGYRCLEQITRMSYPMEIAPTDTTEGARFVRDILHIGKADASGSNQSKDTPWEYGYCLYGDIPTDDGASYGFEPMYIDTVGSGGYPEPGKWWWYVTSYAPLSRCGFPNVEHVTTFQESGLEIFSIDSFLNMTYQGKTTAVLYLSGDDRGNTCYFGHPLYFHETDQITPNFDRIMALFGEQKVVTAGQN